MGRSPKGRGEPFRNMTYFKIGHGLRIPAGRWPVDGSRNREAAIRFGRDIIPHVPSIPHRRRKPAVPLLDQPRHVQARQVVVQASDDLNANRKAVRQPDRRHRRGQVVPAGIAGPEELVDDRLFPVVDGNRPIMAMASRLGYSSREPTRLGSSSTICFRPHSLGGTPRSARSASGHRRTLSASSADSDDIAPHDARWSQSGGRIGERIVPRDTTGCSERQPEQPVGEPELVARGGIEPPTRGFSVHCSTN